MFKKKILAKIATIAQTIKIFITFAIFLNEEIKITNTAEMELTFRLNRYHGYGIT
jgi:hypothetical protein